MMQEIKIGLSKNDPYWESILSQEGVPFEVVSKNLKDYPLIIVNETLDSGDKSIFFDYLERGGLVLSFTNFFENKTRAKWISSFVPKDNIFFNDIALVSLNCRIYPIKDKSYENVGNVVFFKDVDKGKLILLSFNISEILNNVEYSPAPLFTPSGPIFQILPKVSRGSIRKLIRNCLIQLLNHVGLPYVRLSNFPQGYTSVFIFRIDADNYNERDFYETMKILRRNKTKTTYFINQRSYAKNLQDLRELKNYNFEIQSHMNKHCVYNSINKNYDNLHQSIEFLKEFNPTAFVAPFGIFNKSLLSAAEKLGMKYSSEFSYDFDNIPSFPIINGRVSKVLQMPIHPICLESFIEAGRNDKDMIDHFDYLIKKLVHERMPILLYGHPTRVFKNYSTYFDVFEQILDKVNEIEGIWKPTFTEFYKWWMYRLNFSYSIHFDKNNIIVKYEKKSDVDLEIFYKNKFKVSKLTKVINLKGLKRQIKVVDKEREQYKTSSKNFLRLLKCKLLTEYLNYKNMKQ